MGRRLCLLGSFAMHLVAGHAGHGGLVSEVGARDVPGAGGVLRLHEIAYGSVEVHAVAAEAVVHQAAFCVVCGIGEDLRVSGAVRTGVPRSIFMLVAFLAVSGHREDVDVAQADGLWRLREEMDADVAEFGGEAGFVAIHAGGFAVCRGVDCICVVGHLVTAGAALSALGRVVIRRAIYTRYAQERDTCEQECESLEQAHHERKAVPFQLRTSAAEA